MSKRKNNVKKKKLKIIIILLIILVIALIALAALMREPEVPKEVTDIVPDREKFAAESKEYLKDKVIPQHIYDFSTEYTGNVDRNELYERLYTISRFLPDLCSDLKLTDAKSYYSEFSSTIKEYLGIETESEFLKLAEYLEENDVSGLNFEYCVYHTGSLVTGSKYSSFQMDFKYETSDSITLNMEISNRKPASYTLVKVVMN